MPCAFIFALASAGKSSDARMAMMAMTTSNSIKVKAFAPRAFLPWRSERMEWRKSRPTPSFLPLKNLLIRQQPRAQFLVIDFLHGTLVVHGNAGPGRGGLAENHKDRFHANRAVSDVRRRKTDGHEQILALGCFGDKGAIGNRVRFHGRHLDIAFVLHVAVLHDALTIVRIH